MRFDLAVIGGGVNGCGIARDAAGRGLKVVLFEQGDLAQATSSASTKLFHGGLRYLEYGEFRLVREALIERETLLVAMPHIARPMRFVLPHRPGLRPAWMLRLGLFVYDHLGGRRILPGTRTLDLRRDPAGAPLRPGYAKGFEYSDCWVDDARLVVLNARDAAAKGAEIRTRTRFEHAAPQAGGWRVTLEGGAEVWAKAVVNAGGPWVERVIRAGFGGESAARVRLVRGSHIVLRRLFEHDRAYILQQADGRVVFAIPYEGDFTLVGTTDVEHEGPPGEARCTEEERDYLLAAVRGAFRADVGAEDVVWSYSGVRPLYDDGASSATAATRDYVIRLRETGGAAAVDVFGGKITTYRRLSEAALAKLVGVFPAMGQAWTARVPLPGGDFPVDGAEALARDLAARFGFLDAGWAMRLVRCYGTEAAELLAGARGADDLGARFGWNLTEREVRWLMEREWARTAEDVLWRRTKLGLRLGVEEAARLGDWMAAAGCGAARGLAAG
ncbi:MAG TPA: glycerol-3-phosphate dehydrogenase [Amaricoccus sp.]|uniref:glycerol-3-phosphate dehydrogenase n=1 Tax=Amaricoccus sp. TaxID=1872485 RepID=UPI002C41E5BD|nr:glycerol-3-phosphate dehydrogenase [Amaricoccus sp.]HRO12412.1 glycerol-3-phosphate dehydrogenase [Amaricoccus sp.]